MQQTVREESTLGHYRRERSHREGKSKRQMRVGNSSVLCAARPAGNGTPCPWNAGLILADNLWSAEQRLLLMSHRDTGWHETAKHTHTNAMRRPGCILEIKLKSSLSPSPPSLTPPPSLSHSISRSLSTHPPSLSISNQPSCWIIQSKHWPTFTHREHARTKTSSGSAGLEQERWQRERERERERRGRDERRSVLISAVFTWS